MFLTYKHVTDYMKKVVCDLIAIETNKDRLKNKSQFLTAGTFLGTPITLWRRVHLEPRAMTGK